MQVRIVDTIDPEAVPDRSRSAYELEVVALADGTRLSIPVNIVAGTGARPRLLAVAGVHGDEADGILALSDLWETLNPGELTGRLVIVPVANVSAFRSDQRRSPLDELDLNRTFPGRVDGTPSERLAHRLFTELIQRADFLFSLHGWGCQGDVLDYVEFNHHLADTAPASYRACQAAGFRLIRISDWPRGLMTLSASEAGVPGMEAEVGGLGITREASRRRYEEYLLALMRHLGMLPAGPPAPRSHRLVESFDVSSPVGGVLRVKVALGDEVPGGHLLALVHDLHGGTLAAVRAPSAGIIAARREYASVAPGERIVTLFRDVEPSVIAGFR